jgi:hypothetical protein
MASTTPCQPTPALFTSTSTGSACLTSAAVGFVRDVTGRGHDLGVLGRERLQPAFVASGGKDPGPSSRQAQRGDAPDAGGRAGHNHAGEVEIHRTLLPGCVLVF